jgi:beta-lactam-binding protein with PASTA domain/Ca2+-binding RTX toxin-like protein
MSHTKWLTCRRPPSARRWAMALTIAMTVPGIGGGLFVPTVRAQTAPTGQGFVLDAGDLRFIYEQILVAQDHAAGGALLGGGPNQVHDPQLPRGLRTVDGSFNNLVPGQNLFGASDQTFPRLTVPVFRDAETFDPDGTGPAPATPTSYTQKSGIVVDSQPRIITNLIVDQSAHNPAAVAAASHPCGSGGFVCSDPPSLAAVTDPDSGTLFIPNITPDFGLSAPFNLMFTFFGQFFDHGLDLVNKGGGTVIIPLQADDPLFDPGPDRLPNTADDPPTNFMAMARATNLPGPDGILGTADDIHDAINQTTPWVDQNQTYTSHPSHQVFLRQYEMVDGRPVQAGKVLDGGFCAPRGTGISGDQICNIGNWGEVKAQASSKLGIRLTDADVFDVPLVLTDPYGHFKPGSHGFPQLVIGPAATPTLLEGNPAANGGAGVTIPAAALRTNHQFLNDIAHNAVPSAGLTPDGDRTTCDFRTCTQPAGTYDDELLDLHFATGDGRGNENIALTMVHQLLHAEHNRLRDYIDQLIHTPGVLTAAEIAAWEARHAPSGWDYGERLFQAARFVTEMEYQHLVFEEFARTVQPLINPFLGGLTSINAAISAEFAHTVYRLGHSMLPEVLGRTRADGTKFDIRLLNAFLNPLEYNRGPGGTTLTAAQAAGSLIRGLTQQIGNELDEFVTSSVRDTLVGLPLDLPAINIARGRSEGIPPLNEVRRQFYDATHDAAVLPYANWFEFGLGLRHYESLINFIAAYGTHPSITSATTVAAKRTAAQQLVDAGDAILFAAASVSGLDRVDLWPGGMAEKPAVFGGLLGSTFNYVFELQLEHLQDGDRFYYLQRTDGLNLKTQLEGNSLAELTRRNTDAQGTMDVIFNTADFNLNAGAFTGTATVELGDGIQLLTLGDGTKFFFDPLHTGKNIVFNGTSGADRLRADVGDDTMYGNGGNDRLSGGEGNDTLLGGDGDDVLFGDNGDDVIKGGPGNDAMQSGPGFGGDILLGGDGNDFMVGGDDGNEFFAGPGNDIIVDGSMRAEAIVGDAGDDWLDDGEGHDGGMFGDEGNVFDLLAGVSPVGGDDVLGGGPGQDNHFGEGGNDVFLMSEGSNKFFGDYGFDFVTQRGWPFPADIELDLLALPGVIINFNDLRNLYRFTDGASGWDLDDHIRGDNNVNDPTAPIERQLLSGMELMPAYAGKVAGLDQFMRDFGQTLPWMQGNILLGGLGNDTLEGKAGDDLIDGDLWFNVQLEATMNDGSVKLVNGPRELVDDIFVDPPRLSPGHIRIVRTVVTPGNVPAPDCGAPTPRNCDTAVFSGLRDEYSIVFNANRTITVSHIGGPARPLIDNNGTDTLRNIERLQFADGILTLAGATPSIVVPAVVGLTEGGASAALAAAGLTALSDIANSTTAAIGNVIAQTPAAGAIAPAGSTVTIIVSLGTRVPSVLGLTQANATSALSAANLVTTVTSVNNAAPAGQVIGQSPAGGANVQPFSAVALTVSLGPALVTVPTVTGQPQTSATSSITAAGLLVGTITQQDSATVPAGSVIAQTPAGGTQAVAGTAVSLVVSIGLTLDTGLVASFNFNEVNGPAIDAAVGKVAGDIANNGTLNAGVTRVASRTGAGTAAQFDGASGMISIPDSTALHLTRMTLSAWVNSSTPITESSWRNLILKERPGGLVWGLYGNAATDGGPNAYIRRAPIASTGDEHAGTATRLTPGVWTHLAATYDGRVVRVYVNGAQVGSITTSGGNLGTSTGALRLGGNSIWGEFFAGAIDDVRIYNRALSATEIQNLKNTILP